jgi:hypothetical protein
VAGGVGGAAASGRLATGEPEDVGCVAVVVTPEDLGGEMGGWGWVEEGIERGEERG